MINPSTSHSGESRVLLLPPTSRDADAIRKLLIGERIDCVVFRTLSSLCGGTAAGAGALVISEEALVAGHERLQECVRRQPVWSDLPIIVLSRSGAESPKLAMAIARLGNVSVLERPVRVTTLISLVRSALRARERQYQVRAYLAEKQSAEDEREHLLASERAARSELERSGRMKDEFLATLSHELRTPLNAILGWTEILKSHSTDPEEVAEGMEVIERNARAQTQIIEDLLDMSRIISGKVRVHVQPVDLKAVVTAAVQTVQPAINAKGIRCEVQFDPSVPQLSGDPSRLQQVFWNLLTNAVKFTPRGGRISVRADRTESHVEVKITDTGEGIEPAFLPSVFDRFRQADASTTRRHGGLGLGLAIVKQLVEVHGGTIRAHSDGRGRGAVFSVSLPIDHRVIDTAPDGEPAPPVAAPAAPVRPGAIAGVRVLIVDDEPDARLTLKRVLEGYDALVTAASSAVEALERLRSDRPRVLVSDIGMPGEDGYSLIRRVRALEPGHGGGTPAIALTAYARPEDRAKAIAAGFQNHLAKPVRAAELVALVAELAGGPP
jgi:signal transduction histidine kinase